MIEHVVLCDNDVRIGEMYETHKHKTVTMTYLVLDRISLCCVYGNLIIPEV